MIELLRLYSSAMASGLLSTVALALLGCHLAARDQSMQSLVVSQAATVGVLLGAVFLISYRTDHTAPGESITTSSIPLLAGLAVAATAYVFAERFSARRRAAATSIQLAFYTLLLATSYWLVSFFPALESHLSQAFFGDIVTLSGNTLTLISMVSLAALIALVTAWKPLTNHSFIISVMGVSHIGNRLPLQLFRLLSLVLICTSIYALGLLFTMAYLFLPTVIFSFLNAASVRLHFVLVALTASISFVIGFVLSLYFERISTVPTLVLSTGLLGLAALPIINRLLSRRTSRPARHR